MICISAVADCNCFLHVIVPDLPNMPQGYVSIFEDGKLKSGVYKIQNIQSETYLDIEVHTRELCCRSAGNLGEGRGLVGRYSSFMIHV